MKLSQLLFRTSKEAPHDADIPSHRLLERGGYLYKVGRGIYAYSPLMLRVIQKLCQIIREEHHKVGAQEVALPQLHPAELWEESGRWHAYLCEKLLLTTEDRDKKRYCIAPTAEEAATALVSSFVKSYRQLPVNIFQINSKFRDEIRPRFGLMRSKEFLMKDGYSFAADEKGMNHHYQLMSAAYSAILNRLGLRFVLVEAHGGKISQSGRSQEFQVTADIGEDAVMVCGDYAANVEAAKAIPPSFSYDRELKPMHEVATPNVTTIETLAAFLKIAPQSILKTIVYRLLYADRVEHVAIGVRGDRQLNPVKILSRFGAIEIELASADEIVQLTGAAPGFIGPIDLKIPFYADETTRPMTNFACARNKNDLHMCGVNWDRDVKRPEYGDYLLAEQGDGCPERGGQPYVLLRGIEVGHIFNMGVQYSEKLKALFQDEQGEMRPFWMGTYGIGVGRLAQACVEQKWDERGIVWPQCLAPFQVLITAVSTKDEALSKEAERLYHALSSYEPLLDDRPERLGFKLKDSDLIGIPYKLIVGKSFLESGAYEIESRSGETSLVDKEAVLEWAESHLLKS